MTSQLLTKIESLDDTRIINYQSMKDNLLDDTGGDLFVCESDKVVAKLLSSDIIIKSILANESFYNKYADLIFKSETASFYTASNALLNEIIGFRMHSGVMALAKKPKNELLENLSDRIICMNGIVDSENVGSILRNALAFNFDSILHDKQTSSPFLRRSVRVSMGAIFSLKICATNKLISALTFLKSCDYEIISAEILDNSLLVDSFNFPKKFVLVFGSESKGINSEILSISDKVIKISISKKIESINVASSSAVIMSKAYCI